MEDRDLVASLATRGTALPDRPGHLPRMKLGSAFVGEIADADIKQVMGIYSIAVGDPAAAGDAPSIRMAVHRMPGGQVAVIVAAIDDASDATAEWAPFDIARARSLLASLRCRQSLEGRDIEALAHTASCLSWFAHEAPFLATFDAERVAVMEAGRGCMIVTAKARFGEP